MVVGTAVVASNPALNFPMEAYREPQGGGSPVTVDITPQPGVFKITGTGSGVSCNNNFTLRASLESALPGDTVCVKVTADNFNSITGMQFGMSWNPAVIQLIPAIKFPNPPALPSLTQSNFNANNSSTGVLKFQWASGVPVTLPNGTTLFELCFAVVGTTGQSTDIKFIDVPAALPIPALKIEILNQIGEIPFDLAGGKVTVGITAGASTPDWLIEATARRLYGGSLPEDWNLTHPDA